MPYQSFQLEAATAQLFTFDNGSDVREYHLTLTTEPSPLFTNQLTALFKAYDALLAQELSQAQPVFQRFFLSDAANQYESLRAALSARHACKTCATSIVQQPPLHGGKIALWVYLQSGVETKRGAHGLYAVKHNNYTHLWGSSAHAADAAADAAQQTDALLKRYADQLTQARCSLEANCLRTWFFVHPIDTHYAGVVRARNALFQTHGLTKNTHFIASTGIEGRHLDARTLVMLDTYAVKGIDAAQVQYLYAPTHLNRTSDYGVSFERGTALHYGDRTHVFISGTASIDNQGTICHPGDIEAQTKRMCTNVEVLLNEANCSFSQVAPFLVYLRDTADYACVKRIFEARFPAVPTIIVHAPVCRPGWLIEMECMAIKATNNERFPSF